LLTERKPLLASLYGAVSANALGCEKLVYFKWRWLESFDGDPVIKAFQPASFEAVILLTVCRIRFTTVSWMPYNPNQ
jgi:hypothetical protein